MKNRRQREEDASDQVVRRVEKVLLDGPEHFAWVRGALCFPQRGGVTFMQVLAQAFEGVNVFALDLSIAGEQLPEIKRLDKKLEQKIDRMVRKACGSAKGDDEPIQVRLCAIIG